MRSASGCSIGPRRHIKVLKPVRVAKGDAYGEVRPNPRGFRIEAEIEFEHALIGRQVWAVDVKPDTFRREIARARTFGFLRDVASLWNAGYALGASLENTLVVSDNRILNPEGTRFADEFVRHKVLDAVGDLALAGAPLLGTYRSVRGGHKLNHAVLCALMSDASAWTWVEGEMPRPAAAHAEMVLPIGTGLRPGQVLSASSASGSGCHIPGGMAAYFVPPAGAWQGAAVEPRVGDGIHPIHGFAFSGNRRG